MMLKRTSTDGPSKLNGKSYSLLGLHQGNKNITKWLHNDWILEVQQLHQLIQFHNWVKGHKDGNHKEIKYDLNDAAHALGKFYCFHSLHPKTSSLTPAVMWVLVLYDRWIVMPKHPYIDGTRATQKSIVYRKLQKKKLEHITLTLISWWEAFRTAFAGVPSCQKASYCSVMHGLINTRANHRHILAVIYYRLKHIPIWWHANNQRFNRITRYSRRS